jgi:hypothetical protein
MIQIKVINPGSNNPGWLRRHYRLALAGSRRLAGGEA